MEIENFVILSVYLLAWIIVYIWYKFQDKIMDGGSVIILSYVGYAFFSILSYNDPESVLRHPYLPLEVAPFVFLFAMLIIALLPTMYHRTHPMETLPSIPMKIVRPTCWLFALCGFMWLPYVTMNFSTGILNLFSNSEAGVVAYRESLLSAIESGRSVSNIPSIIYNMLYDVCTFFFFYLLTNYKANKRLLIAMAIALPIAVIITIMQGQRSTAIPAILTLILGYFVFQRYYTERLRRVVKLLGLISIILIMLPVAAITISRFSSNEATHGVKGSLTWYIGQANIYFSNYAFDDGGTREGTRVFNLPKRILNPSTPVNFVERREMYRGLKIGDDVFSTFVGDFVIDVGTTWTAIIFVVFNFIILCIVRHPDGGGSAYQMLTLYMTMCICMQGGMTLFTYSDTAGLKLLAFMTMILVLYLYHRSRTKHGINSNIA